MPLGDEAAQDIVARLRCHIGLRGESMTREIEKGALLKFCRAVGETDPVFTDDAHARRQGYRALVAPPTYLSIFSEACGAVLQKDFPLTQFLHTDDVISAYLPICAGDVVTATPVLADVFAKRSSRGILLFQVVEIELVNQFEARVASLRVTMAHHE